MNDTLSDGIERFTKAVAEEEKKNRNFWKTKENTHFDITLVVVGGGGDSDDDTKRYIFMVFCLVVFDISLPWKYIHECVFCTKITRFTCSKAQLNLEYIKERQSLKNDNAQMKPYISFCHSSLDSQSIMCLDFILLSS